MNKLGFGFLHLPMQENNMVDYAGLNKMVDAYLASGGTYFDSAYTYLNGGSELALRETLVNRHPRDQFQICTKLPGYKVKTKEDCYRFFAEEQERCGVDYFDVYMLHWLNEKHYRIAEKTGQFDFLKELKASGKAKRIGFSYHDTADLLDEILTAHPEVECVLMQLNYADWESESIQSRRCYETAVRHSVSVMVMEPVKGGTLADPPENVRKHLKEVDPEGTPYSMALRFAESLPGVEIVLSGMSELWQVEENMKDRAPLSEAELSVMLQAAKQINSVTAIPCSGCGYCLNGCPKNICIPNYFRLYNEITRRPCDGWKIEPAYAALTRTYGKASECIECRSCEGRCPQKLSITKYMKDVLNTFERKN
ncbi:MAG: aldo/keto reductase [Lachnospiraceae bacterium]|nr:aldo/keto reductase [Lachnospiraceae bacterium]